MSLAPLTSSQVRAARALLAWSQQDLAREARVAQSTVADFERGQRTPVANNADAIRAALEKAGISFPTGGAVIGPAPVSRRSAQQGGMPIRWVDATDLSQWADRRLSQGSMPQLLTQLIRAATGSASRIEFPSDESIQLGGWDGTCEVDVGTEQIPSGSSGWEIGTQRTKIADKATDDFKKRTADPLGLNRRKSSFVFVTPRRWPQKKQWSNARRAEKKWRDVRAYDADDLVHWIELYPAVGHSLAVAMGKRPTGVQQLHETWEEWSLSTRQRLSTELILTGRDEEAARVLRWLRSDPSILSIQAESPDEAVAFLYAAIAQLPEPYQAEYLARCLVAADPQTARTLGDSISPLIIVLEDAEAGLARRLTERGHHVFIAKGPGGSPDDGVQLSRPPRDGVEHALMNMSFEREAAGNLARDSARSLAVLRRLMPSAPARVPAWATGTPSRCLIAALLAGAWNEDSDGDKAVLARLADEKYDVIVAELAPLVGFLEKPLRKAGTVWKVASPRDAWFRLADRISPADFSRFQAVAHDVLASRDPRFEMEPSERWLAGMKGVRPEYSGFLRRGLGETLILFSLYGRHVPTVTAVTAGVDNIVRKLLEDADPQRWWSLSGEFQLLAEAAPGVFLNALDTAVQQSTSIDVLFAEDDGFAGGTYLSDLLWALESLGWSAQYLGRVVSILGKLAARDPGGRYSNRPANSLRNIFLLWFPQTHVPLAGRLRVLDQLRKQESDVAWKVMLGVLPSGHDTATPASHTRWRDLSTDEQEVITYPLIAKGGDEIASRLLVDVGLRIDRWEELVGAFANLPPEYRNAMVERLSSAAPSINDDEDRARIANALRRVLSHHREFPGAEWALPEPELQAIEAAYVALQPRDPIKRSAWLFSSHVQLPTPTTKMVDGQHVDRSWEDDQREANRQRVETVAEVLAQSGIDEVLALAHAVELPELVGRASAELTGFDQAKSALLIRTLAGESRVDEAIAHGIIVGSIIREGEVWVDGILEQSRKKHWGDAASFRILRALPDTKETWDRAAAAGPAVDDLYWRLRNVLWIDPAKGDLVYAIERLLKAHRAKAAINVISHNRKEHLPGALLVRVLDAAVREPWTDVDLNSASMFRHDVIDIFKRLDQSGDTPDEKIASLEWAYLPLFQFSDRPPRMLQKALATEPGFFVEVLKKVYRPTKESGLEEPEPEDMERERAIVHQAFDLLHHWSRVPGITENGQIDGEALEAWVREARILAEKAGRGAVGDSQIGQVLAHAPPDAEGIWPADAVRTVIEITRSKDLDRGVGVGIHNRRGVTSRAMNDGGAQERELARYYRKCSDKTALEWPRTSALLEEVAKSYEHEGTIHDDDAERRDW